MLKIRASQLGLLFSEPKTKTAKEAGELSETAKSLIADIWLKNITGYDEPVVSDEMLKGLLCEQDAMQLVCDTMQDGIFRTKYDGAKLENDYVMGQPDIVLNTSEGIIVEDIKCSFTAKTFHAAGLSNLYVWQLRAYMWLLGANVARLHYCLVDTPPEMILDLQKRYWYKFGMDDSNTDYIKICKQLEVNHTPSKCLAPIQRIKSFEVDLQKSHLYLMINKIEQARQYYDSLKWNDGVMTMYLKSSND